MNPQIEIEDSTLNEIIDEYIEDSETKELEIVYGLDKSAISEKSLKKIISYLNKLETPNTKENVFILDVFLLGNSDNSRFSIETNSANNLLGDHCKFEKDNIEGDKYFPSNYKLLTKDVLKKKFVDTINSKINIKTEIPVIETKDIDNFINIYSKFKKRYRFKHRQSYNFGDFRVDITIVKQSEGHNILLSRVDNIVEKIELEIEFINRPNLVKADIKKSLSVMIELMIKFNQFNNEGYFNISNDEKKELHKNYMDVLKKVLSNKNNKGIGPKPLSLTNKTLLNMLLAFSPEDKDKNIDSMYKITEKADGERYFMYIYKNIIYLINDNKNIIKTGLKLVTDTFNDSILDGELLNYKNESDKLIYEYRFFDIYMLNKNEIYTTNLNGRIKEMTRLSLELENNVEYYIDSKNSTAIICKMKKYRGISEFRKIINQDEYKYKIDGAIFMPVNKLADISNSSYSTMLKYKPIEENTIDILVLDNKLWCSYRLNNDYIKTELMCVKPYIVDLSTKPIKKMNNAGELVDIKNTLNNKIVEVLYDIEGDCFMFNNIRYDKTEKYLKTGKMGGTANDFYVVNDILHYSFNMIEEKVMETINVEYIESLKMSLEKGGSYYDTENTYQKKEERQLRSFQNKMKAKLINNAVSILENYDVFQNIKMQDIACGRGGDLLKYINTNFVDNKLGNSLKEKGGIKFILGFDIDSIGIEYIDKANVNNTSRGRYLQYKNDYIRKNSTVPDIYKNDNVFYMTGNVNSYKKSNDVKTSFDNIMDGVTYGDGIDNNDDFETRTKYEKKMLDDIDKKYGVSGKKMINIYEKHQYELLSCQFAIHYFDLSIFCKYIDLHLAPGGLFICTYMEKEKVDKLFEKHKTDIITGGPKSFWSLKKSETEGNIDVYFKTMGNDEHRPENLVSKEMIEAEFKQYGIKIYESTFKSDDISGVLSFEDHINDDNKEFEFNKLYNGLIFQKNLDTKDKSQLLQKTLEKIQ